MLEVDVTRQRASHDNINDAGTVSSATHGPYVLVSADPLLNTRTEHRGARIKSNEACV